MDAREADLEGKQGLDLTGITCIYTSPRGQMPGPLSYRRSTRFTESLPIDGSPIGIYATLRRERSARSSVAT
jgi:hypothetical protein